MAAAKVVSANKLSVSCSGGSHQFVHFLPVVFVVARTTDVELFVNNAADAQAALDLASEMGARAPVVTVMLLPRLLEWFAQTRLGGRLAKGFRLLWWSRSLRRATGLLAAERTSTLLCRLPGTSPLMLHIPHGAGDRAKGFEARFSLFDAVLVAGEKDRGRLVAMGRVQPANCHVTGSIKLAALRRMAQPRVPLFDNDRPVVLYSPHFDLSLSSWDDVSPRIIEAIVADGRYNLVIAPHVRLFASRPRWAAEEWASKAIPGRVLVDTGSARSNDMTYTGAADIYLGDVSSQVYESIVRPRPCLFFNSHAAAWQGNPDYAMWAFGRVAEAGCDLIAAIDNAFATHDAHRVIQQTAARAALGPDAVGRDQSDGGSDAIDRAAGLIVKLLGNPQPTAR